MPAGLRRCDETLSPALGAQPLEIHRQRFDHLDGAPLIGLGALLLAVREGAVDHQHSADVDPTKRKRLLGPKPGVGQQTEEHPVALAGHLGTQALDLLRGHDRGARLGHRQPSDPCARIRGKVPSPTADPSAADRTRRA